MKISGCSSRLSGVGRGEEGRSGEVNQYFLFLFVCFGRVFEGVVSDVLRLRLGGDLVRLFSKTPFASQGSYIAPLENSNETCFVNASFDLTLIGRRQRKGDLVENRTI